MVAADLFLNSGDGINNLGFSLQTNSNLALDTFDVNGLVANLNVNQIFIGASGHNPTVAELAAITQFQSANSSALQTINRDRLIGGSQDDTLIGGVGVDLLTGGAGSDTFFYKAINHRNDRITDFEISKDTLIFSRAGFDSELTPDQFLSEEQFAIGLGATDDDERFIYNPNNGNLFFDADGDDSNPRLLITTLTNTPDLTHRDIFIVS